MLMEQREVRNHGEEQIMTQQNQRAKLWQSKQIAGKQKALIKFNLSRSQNNMHVTSSLTNYVEKT